MHRLLREVGDLILHSHLDSILRRPCLSASSPSLFTVSCLVFVGLSPSFDVVRIAHFALCLVYGYNTYTIGVLPIYNYGSFGPFILDITSNVVFFLTMLVYINLTYDCPPSQNQSALHQRRSLHRSHEREGGYLAKVADCPGGINSRLSFLGRHL